MQVLEKRSTNKSISELGMSVLNIRDQAKGASKAILKLQHPKSVLIIGKSSADGIVYYTRELARYIIASFKQKGIEMTVYLDKAYLPHRCLMYDKLKEQYGDSISFWDKEFCEENHNLIDFIITLGGDGTVLNAAWLFQNSQVPPVIPFHLGSLGFLTVFRINELGSILDHMVGCGGARVNMRMRLACTIYRSKLDASQLSSVVDSPASNSQLSTEDIPMMHTVCGDSRQSLTTTDIEKTLALISRNAEPESVRNILNDLGPSAYMSQLEVFVDDEHLTSVQADGLVVATPTGSTAYSLAAGGSLVHPEVPSFLLTPICAHSLSFRPMILPDSSELKIQVPTDSRTTAWVGFDGRERAELKPGDFISIKLSRHPMPSVCADNQSSDWFKSLKQSLHWNRRVRQKPFEVTTGMVPVFKEFDDGSKLESLANEIFND